MIPLDQVTVLGSNPRVLAFPAVANITNLGLRPGALHVEVDHAAAWPMVAVTAGGAPAQCATLWVFLQVGGRWHAAGAERLRPGQISGEDKPEDGNVDSFIGVNWLFDANRWGVMAGHVPALGERVGMMVAAGSTRSDDTTPIEERTKVLEFAWPGPSGAANIQPMWTEGQGDDVDPDPPSGPTLRDVMAKLEAIERSLADLAHQADANTSQIQQQIDLAVKNLEASSKALLDEIRGILPRP